MNYNENAGALFPSFRTGLRDRLLPDIHASPQIHAEPYRRPFCRDTPHCNGCPYCGHGFVCHGDDGKCIRLEVARLNHFEIQEEQEDADTGETE